MTKTITQAQADQVLAASWSLQEWVRREINAGRPMAAISEAIICEANKIEAADG